MCFKAVSELNPVVYFY